MDRALGSPLSPHAHHPANRFLALITRRRFRKVLENVERPAWGLRSLPSGAYEAASPAFETLRISGKVMAFWTRAAGTPSLPSRDPSA
jgi:hypothetical protein